MGPQARGRCQSTNVSSENFAHVTPGRDSFTNIPAGMADIETMTPVVLSTLLRTVFGIVEPRAGHIRFAGEEIAHRPPTEVLKRGIGYVPRPSSRASPCSRPSVTTRPARSPAASSRFSRRPSPCCCIRAC